MGPHRDPPLVHTALIMFGVSRQSVSFPAFPSLAHRGADLPQTGLVAEAISGVRPCPTANAVAFIEGR